MRKVKYGRGLCMMAAITLFLSQMLVVKAEGEYQLQQITTNQDQIIAYITGEEMPTQVDYQIGMDPCEEVAFGTIDDMGEMIHTIILMDNSLSITKENRAKALEFLRQYVQKIGEREEISIAVYGEDIQFLQRKATDSAALLEAIDSIGSYNRDTYLTDVLYDLLDELNDETDYTRFIIISDGVDNKDIGITKDELINKLKENLHPVYTIGHIYKGNQTQLENMFALSRITQGQDFLLDNMSDVSELMSQLQKADDLICIKATVPKELHDGSHKNSLFTLHAPSGEHELTSLVTMPFSIRETEPEPTPEPTAAPTAEPTPEPTAAPTPEPTPEPVPESASGSNELLTKIIAILVIILVGVILILLVKKKENKGKEKKKDLQEIKVQEPIPAPAPAPAPIPAPAPEDVEGTILLNGRYLLVLRDQNDQNKIFKYPMDSKVIVGRNVDRVNIAIDYSKTISGQHCEFSVRNNRFFVRDLQSANHTYANGVMVNGEVEVTSGSTIRIGEVEFYIEFIPI